LNKLDHPNFSQTGCTLIKVRSPWWASVRFLFSVVDSPGAHAHVRFPCTFFGTILRLLLSVFKLLLSRVEANVFVQEISFYIFYNIGGLFSLIAYAMSISWQRHYAYYLQGLIMVLVQRNEKINYVCRVVVVVVVVVVVFIYYSSYRI